MSARSDRRRRSVAPADEVLVIPELGDAGGDDALADPDDDLEAWLAAFERWAVDPLKEDHVVVAGSGTVPLGRVLARLRAHPASVSRNVAAGLGLPPWGTVGEVATALYEARELEGGPRCRSYRSAVYFLRGLVELDEDEDAGPGTRSDSVRAHLGSG